MEAVREVAPHIPDHIIHQDLSITGSVNATITNIFEGRIQIPENIEINENRNANDNNNNQNHNNHSSSSIQTKNKSTALIDDLQSIKEEIHRLEELLKIPTKTGYGSSTTERKQILEDRKKALQHQSRLYVFFILLTFSFYSYLLFKALFEENVGKKRNGNSTNSFC